MMLSKSFFILSLIIALAGIVSVADPQDVVPPANAPATVEWNVREGKLSLQYHDTVILDATISAESADGDEVEGSAVKLQRAVKLCDQVEQRLKFVPAQAQAGIELVLRGTVLGSAEAFPAETRSAAQDRFPYVRNSVGLSCNLRNNALYDRRWDWVLIGPAHGATHIKAQRVAKQEVVFSWESRGSSLELVFRPRFYQKHKKLEHFKPWIYTPWKGSVTGFCTWWAYRHGFNQDTLDVVVDVFKKKNLCDFGYQYIQLDDCYQIGNGSCPDNWLTWNDRFPGGWEYTTKRIRSVGMQPGIWVHRVHRPSDPGVANIGKEHPEWFVNKPNGTLFMDHGFYLLNTHNEEALEAMAHRTYRALKAQDWAYVKIDGAGDLLRAYEKLPEYFEKINSTPGETLRKWDQVARDELGTDVFILNCWGVRPGINVIGLADGCRLGSDGFGPAEFQRFNSWNGVIWRNDPDHCDILAEWLKHKTTMKTFNAREATADSIIQPSIVSMAGGVLMVSDKVEAYQDDSNLEGMKRSAPVLFTVPGQLYDYTQRKPGNYGAPLRGDEAPWWLLEIDRPFDHWSVLARFNWRQKKLDWKRPGRPEEIVRFADLGLTQECEYLVFEFWTQNFMGKFKGSFTAPAQDASNGLQVFAIREARAHPWIISTSRHISQGGVDLLDVKWNYHNKTLSGSSSVVKEDPYIMTIYVPEGLCVKTVEAKDEDVETENLNRTAIVRMTPSVTRTVSWRIAFAE